MFYFSHCTIREIKHCNASAVGGVHMQNSMSETARNVSRLFQRFRFSVLVQVCHGLYKTWFYFWFIWVPSQLCGHYYSAVIVHTKKSVRVSIIEKKCYKLIKTATLRTWAAEIPARCGAASVSAPGAGPLRTSRASEKCPLSPWTCAAKAHRCRLVIHSSKISHTGHACKVVTAPMLLSAGIH